LSEYDDRSFGPPRLSGKAFIAVTEYPMAGSLFDRLKSLFRTSEAESPPIVQRKPVSAYHAVSIVPGRNACTAACALRDRRFLSNEAPVLPLPGCNASPCVCRYEHHDDRRKGLRRARDLAVSVDGYDGPDKRDCTKRGRRKSDLK
jgi:hypothetical protein